VAKYLEVVRKSGLVDVQEGAMVDVFSGSPDESYAREFDTNGLTFTATKTA
jgi:hypothetical protein